MPDLVAWVGRRAGQWWVIPQHKRLRFRSLGGTCNRPATAVETKAALNTHGLGSIFPLSFLTKELARVVAEPAQSVHSVPESAATHLSKPKRKRATRKKAEA